MRILLVGEYSRLHNSLKEGLIALGHEVFLAGNRGGFKNYPVDLNLYDSFSHGVLKKLKVGFYKLTSLDVGAFEIYLKTLWHFKKLKNFEVVQLINEYSIMAPPHLEITLLKKLLAHNKSLFLLSCGGDYKSIAYMMSCQTGYTMMTPYINDFSLYKQYKFQLRYLNKEFKALHKFIYEHCKGVIASDMDYHLPLLGDPHYLGLIPNPVNTEKITYQPLKIENCIKIFHGINKEVQIMKGNNYFTEALAVIKKKYGNKVVVVETMSLPYTKYSKMYDDCHILLDQVYSYDQGYNALEAMAKGKVVFTGAEQVFTDYYGLTERVAVNALPDVEYLVQQLSFFIENPLELVAMGARARAFVEKEHHYIKIAKRYVEVWAKAVS